MFRGQELTTRSRFPFHTGGEAQKKPGHSTDAKEDSEPIGRGGRIRNGAGAEKLLVPRPWPEEAPVFLGLHAITDSIFFLLDFLIRSYKNVSIPSNNSQLSSVWPRYLRSAWL